MKRLQFDSQGKLVGVDGGFVRRSEERLERQNLKLHTSKDLEFLKEDKSVGNVFEKNFWSLYKDNEKLKPLEFSNGKTQEDIVKEIHELIKQGEKIIFLQGACGTGKSAIALNLARVFGKASIVVPVKTLQSQYEKDYSNGMYLLKSGGEKLKIAMITGRENHDSLIFPGRSCADPMLPDTIKITDKNYEKVMEYYEENPLISSKEVNDIKKIRRMSIAPTNPYWSPIISADYEANQLSDARKHSYPGCDGKKYVFYHRKQGCSYYDQYLAYEKADVIIFNSAKYNAELALGRKPLTEIDIIDEADVFLDNLFEQSELSLTWLGNALKNLNLDSEEARESVRKIRELLELEERNKKALGIDESKIFKIGDTKLKEIIQILNKDQELQAEILIDEMNYSNKALEVSRDFADSLQEVYVNYRKDEDNLFVRLVSTNLSYKIKDLMSKTKALVLMSGTLHSKEVLEHIFQIGKHKIVEAETLNPGSMEIIRTGKEFDCKYSNFKSGEHTREDYLDALDSCLAKAEKPTLVHVQAYQDLPSELEINNFSNLISKEFLMAKQGEDRFGKGIEKFKQGKFSTLFSTKCSRGVDFPGEICKSVVFTKYPNPNVQDIFWKVIQQTHSAWYWEFYRDKAKREFLQRMFRAIRFKDDRVSILSPDIRVLQAVQELQKKKFN